MTPTATIYELGDNQHKQPIRVTVTSNAVNIHRAQADQRDDSADISITLQQFRAIAEIAKVING